MLIVDRMERVGDNWCLRYDGLNLHNLRPINHLRYVLFPEDWPDYIPKDDVADWLERYVERMGLRFRTRTEFEGATDDAAKPTMDCAMLRHSRTCPVHSSRWPLSRLPSGAEKLLRLARTAALLYRDREAVSEPNGG